jgi:23S rRNA G2445 N2-methylase RlmL
MTESTLHIKLECIPGLEKVVRKEIAPITSVRVHESESAAGVVYIECDVEQYKEIVALRSVQRAYVVTQDAAYTPKYIAKHKSVVGACIERVVTQQPKAFKTFKISCAGADSPEVRAIADYIADTFSLTESEEADLKVRIVKLGHERWEVGVQMTPRPLSLREYKVAHMSGAMDPTIAYAMNSLGTLAKATSYLNVFSGSATLLIEAGLQYPHLETLVGFDNDKKYLSLAMQNIKKAGLVRRVQLKEGDVNAAPELGEFDVIAADLPFGMAIAKGEDLAQLYAQFVAYCEKALRPGGRLLVYTSQSELFEASIAQSRFAVLKTVPLRQTTAVDAYLRSFIFVCVLR